MFFLFKEIHLGGVGLHVEHGHQTRVPLMGLCGADLAAGSEAPSFKATFVFLLPWPDLWWGFGLSVPQLTWVT